MPDVKALTIGKVADMSGISVETVRFYERKGLIEEPPRKESGYRQYPVDTVNRLLFIRRAKELGFSLEEIKDLLHLKIDPSSTCEQVKAKAEEKIASIEEKVNALNRMKEVLLQLTEDCPGEVGISDCPILYSLEGKK